MMSNPKTTYYETQTHQWAAGPCLGGSVHSPARGGRHESGGHDRGGSEDDHGALHSSTVVWIENESWSFIAR